MIVPTVNRYRWLGCSTDSGERALVSVRYEAVASYWPGVPVYWLRETIRRPKCDFPIFYSIVRCFSKSALRILQPYMDGTVEILSLDGAEDEYSGIHCIKWIDAANLDGVDVTKTSIYSTEFVPMLKSDAIGNLDFFGVQGMVAKLFVSARVKHLIEANGLTGCDFHPVALC